MQDGTTQCNEKVMKTCIYSVTIGTKKFCDYINIVGHSRGCPPSSCDKYKRKRRRRSAGAAV